MKVKNLVKLTSLSIVMASFAGCAFGKKKSFDIYWLDWNGSILELDRDVPIETMPTFDGEAPKRATDDAATYSFKGWDKEISEVKGEEKYTAVYEATPRKYKVTWLNFDNSILKEDEIDYGTMPAYKGETPKKPSTLLVDYTFIGWDRTISKVKGDVTYKAVFDDIKHEPIYLSYEITETKHEVINSNPETLRKGSTITLADPTAKGYDFKGWYLDDEFTVKIDSALANLDHNITVYGKFEPHTYKITYDNANGVFGEGEENITSLTCEDEPFELFNPTKVGYVFNKWQDSKGVTYSTLEDVCEDIDLHAVFDANEYVITLKYTDKSDEFVPIKYDGKVSLPVLEKKGYNFVGWFDKETDTKFELDNYTLLKDVTLYAKWEGPISYNISYNLNGGIVDGEEPNTYTVDNFPTLLDPTREGYDFVGWYLNEKPFTTFRNLAEDIELVAQWNPHNVSISYSYNGGTLERKVTYVNGENMVAEKLVSPFEYSEFILLEDNENAQFRGWKNEMGQFVSFKNDLTINSDYVLTADWAEVRSDAIAAKIGDELEFKSNGSNSTVFQFTSLYAQDIKLEFSAETYIVASFTNEDKSPINNGNQNKYSKEFVLDSIHLEANKTYFLTVYATGEGEHSINVKTISTSDNQNSLSGKINSLVYKIEETSQKFDENFVSPGTPVKENKVFNGWIDADGNLYTADTILKDELIILSASWVDPVE